MFKQSLLEFNSRTNILQNIQHFIRFLGINSTSGSNIHNIIIQLVQVGDQAVALELSSGLAGSPEGPQVSVSAALIVWYQSECIVFIAGPL